MKYIVVAFLALLALSSVYAEVQVLTDENFASSIASGVWFVKFYAPWCGHCKSLAPKWDEMGDLVGSNWNVAKVDCTVHKDICNAQGVRGYPTLLLFKDGEGGQKYSGKREVADLVAFVEGTYPEVPKTTVRGANPAAGEGANPAAAAAAAAAVDSAVVDLNKGNFDQVKTGDWIVEFFAPWCGHCKKMAPAWEELAKLQKEKQQFKVGKVDVTVESDLATEYGIRSMPTIKYFKNGEVIDYTSGDRSVDALNKWAVEQKTGQAAASAAAPAAGSAAPAAAGSVEKSNGVAILGENNFDGEVTGKKYFVKFFAPWCGHCKKMAADWETFAQQSGFNVGEVDCTVHNPLCSKYEVRGFPTILLFKEDGSSVKYSGARNVAEWTNFWNSN